METKTFFSEICSSVKTVAKYCTTSFSCFDNSDNNFIDLTGLAITREGIISSCAFINTRVFEALNQHKTIYYQ